MEKKCPKCLKVLLIENFDKCRGRKDGHAGHCKKCKLQGAQILHAKRLSLPHINISFSYKYCHSCKKNIPVELFSKCRTRPDGLNFYCKSCQQKKFSVLHKRGKAAQIDKNYKKQCKTCKKLLLSESYYRHPTSADLLHNDCKYCMNEKYKQYSNTPEHREASRKAVLKHRTTKREHYLIVHRLRQNKRRAKMNGNVTRQEWDDILMRYNSSCAYCGVANVKLEMEHVKPISRGGLHHRDNIVPSCSTCNRKKHARHLILF